MPGAVGAVVVGRHDIEGKLALELGERLLLGAPPGHEVPERRGAERLVRGDGRVLEVAVVGREEIELEVLPRLVLDAASIDHHPQGQPPSRLAAHSGLRDACRHRSAARPGGNNRRELEDERDHARAEGAAEHPVRPRSVTRHRRRLRSARTTSDASSPSSCAPTTRRVRTKLSRSSSRFRVLPSSRAASRESLFSGGSITTTAEPRDARERTPLPDARMRIVAITRGPCASSARPMHDPLGRRTGAGPACLGAPRGCTERGRSSPRRQGAGHRRRRARRGRRAKRARRRLVT